MTYKYATSQIALPWGPSRHLPSGLVVAQLYYDVWHDSLTVMLGRVRTLVLSPHIICRVDFHHIYALRMLDECNLAEGKESRAVEEQIQLITPSQFAAWFHQESEGYHLDQDLQHYRILTWDRCVDILTATEPELFMLPTE